MRFLPRLCAVLALSSLSALGGEVFPSRAWTDAQGRTLHAALVAGPASPTGNTIQLRRNDGVRFTLPLATLSEADQDYVDATIPPTPARVAAQIHAMTPEEWAAYDNAAPLPIVDYKDVELGEVVKAFNEHLAAKSVRTPQGKPLTIRLARPEMAKTIKVTCRARGISPAMFALQIAESSELEVKVHARGFLLLIPKNPDAAPAPPVKFLGL